MSNRFPCACPRARQIVGKKNWLGYAGAFAFPGFKANWVNTYQHNPPLYNYYYGASTGGAWQFTADGGALTGSAANFNVGDLVLREFPPIGPITDYLTGIAQSYPKWWNVYVCTAAITASATDPDTDTTHFQPWPLWDTDLGTTDGSGPSGWPNAWNFLGYFAQTTNTALAEFTVTTELDNFPLYPATLSGLIAKLGTPNDTAQSYANTTVQEAAAAGTFTYDWTFPSSTFGGALGILDGAAPVYTPAGAAPSAAQASLVFPAVPLWHQTSLAYVFNGDGTIASIFGEDPAGWSESTSPYPALVTWNFSATQIQLQFAAWSWHGDQTYNFELGYYGSLATAPGTITQTLTLGGAAYTLAAVATQAAALRDVITFDSIAWRTSWTNTYGTGAAVVSTQNTVASGFTALNESGQIGTPVTWAVAINGCPAGYSSGPFPYFSTKAQVDICGYYCVRTYQEGTVGPIACANGNVDGYAPFILSPPATPGQAVAAYNAAQC